jgi:hypothetical protein
VVYNEVERLTRQGTEVAEPNLRMTGFVQVQIPPGRWWKDVTEIRPDGEPIPPPVRSLCRGQPRIHGADVSPGDHAVIAIAFQSLSKGEGP